MDALERSRDVERAHGGDFSGVRTMKPHPVCHALHHGVLPRQLDGDFVRIEAVHRYLRIGDRDRDRGPAGAAPDIDHASRRLSDQSLVHRRDVREPIVRQRGEEDGPIAEALPLDVVPTVRLVGHAPSGPKGLDHVLERIWDGEQLPDRCAHVGKGIAVQQDLGVAGRERERGVLLLNVGAQDTGGRLLLQPLPRVPLRGTGPPGQLLRRNRAPCEDLVEAEALAQADRQQVEVSQGRLKELLCERVPVVSIALHGG